MKLENFLNISFLIFYCLLIATFIPFIIVKLNKTKHLVLAVCATAIFIHKIF